MENRGKIEFDQRRFPRTPLRHALAERALGGYGERGNACSEGELRDRDNEGGVRGMREQRGTGWDGDGTGRGWDGDGTDGTERGRDGAG